MKSVRKAHELVRRGFGGRMVLAALLLVGLAALGCQQAPQSQRPQPPADKPPGQAAQKPTPAAETALEKPLAAAEEKPSAPAEGKALGPAEEKTSAPSEGKPSASGQAVPSRPGEAAAGLAPGKTGPQVGLGPESAKSEPQLPSPSGVLMSKTLPGEKVFPSPQEPTATPPPTKPDAAGAPAKEAAAQEEANPFDPKEIERRRKMIEEEMQRLEAEWREKQKKRIAELGPPLVENVEKLIRLHPVFPVWADRENKRIILVGEVCQRKGMLEMFACLRRTKEHESIVVVDTTAQIVHAGLLAVGAEAGRPVQFHPTYRPAAGDEIEVTVIWKDKEGRQHTARAQDWVRHSGTKKAMEHPWVFAGSMFSKSEETGQVSYMADGGDFICVSNFPTAMLDLPVASSNLNAELQFEAFTERIPPEGTPVTLILTPKKKAVGPAPSAKPSEPSAKPASPDRPPPGSSPEKSASPP